MQEPCGMFRREFLNDSRYVDMSSHVKNWDAATDALKPFPSSLQCFAAMEPILDDRHTAHLDFYVFDRPTEVLIVHLGAVKDICAVLAIEYPERSIAIRLLAIRRHDVHLRGVTRSVFSQTHMVDRLMLQAQNIESIRRALSGSAASVFVEHCLDVEFAFQTTKHTALSLMR